MTYIILLVFAYLCGSIPFGKIAGHLRGIDIQKKGSGNIGFANAARILGWKTGLAVLTGDILKGVLPVLIAKRYLNFDQLLIVALLAIIGHIFPVWLRFKGGKGVATGLGITLALNTALAGLGILVYLLGRAIFRESAPSSLAASWSLPVFCWVLYPKYAVFYLLLAVLTSWTHSSNIKLMLARIRK